jgi:hypothetical protein
MSELQTGDGATHRIWTDYHAGTAESNARLIQMAPLP